MFFFFFDYIWKKINFRIYQLILQKSTFDLIILTRFEKAFEKKVIQLFFFPPKIRFFVFYFTVFIMYDPRKVLKIENNFLSRKMQI